MPAERDADGYFWWQRECLSTRASNVLWSYKPTRIELQNLGYRYIKGHWQECGKVTAKEIGDVVFGGWDKVSLPDAGDHPPAQRDSFERIAGALERIANVFERSWRG